MASDTDALQFVIRISLLLHMPYECLEEFGTADIAFEVNGRDLPELVRDAADATTNVMNRTHSRSRLFFDLAS